MEDLREQKLEALQAAKEYLEKLIPGFQELIPELKGNKQADTDEFFKQCLDGLNWIIEIYNRVSDIINEDSVKIEREDFNNKIIRFNDAMKSNMDARKAESLETDIIPFLMILKNTIDEILK